MFNKYLGSVDDPYELHVFQDPSSCPHLWRVRGKQGDYGLVETREEAISIALDAKVTAIRDARIYVHSGHGYPRSSRFVITRVRGRKPSTQFFQDNVP